METRLEATGQAGFYSGTSGIMLPVKNKQFFPPEFADKSRLTYYATFFNSIEINSSFYKIPMASTVAKWADQVPVNFRFTFKLWRGITHNKGLIFEAADVERFMHTIDEVGAKKGCLLVQFPPGLKINMVSQLEKLLVEITGTDTEREWNIALEFRNDSWYDDSIFDLCDRYNAGIVAHDKRAAASSFLDLAADFKYLRFHGPGGDYKGDYSDDFLYDNALLASEWTQEGKQVYAYFNNTVGGAVKNLNTLNSSYAEIVAVE